MPGVPGPLAGRVTSPRVSYRPPSWMHGTLPVGPRPSLPAHRPVGSLSWLPSSPPSSLHVQRQRSGGWAVRLMNEHLPPPGAGLALPGGALELHCGGKSASLPPPRNSRQQSWGSQARYLQVHPQKRLPAHLPEGLPPGRQEVTTCPSPKKGDLPGGGPSASCTSSLTLEDGVHLGGTPGPLRSPGEERACPRS